MKQIRDTTLVRLQPPFLFVNPEDGYRISNGRYDLLKRDAKIYRQANNYPIGSEWDSQFDDIVCSNCPAEYCDPFIPPTMLEKATKLTQSLYQWALSGFPVRTEAEVEAILSTCRSCPHYDGENGFLRVVCKLCGCTKKKLYLRTEECPDTPPRWK